MEYGGQRFLFHGGGLPLEIPQTIACSTVFVLYSDPQLECCVHMDSAISCDVIEFYGL